MPRKIGRVYRCTNVVELLDQYGFIVTNTEDLRRTHQYTGGTVAQMVLTKIDKASVGIKEIIQASVNKGPSTFDFRIF